uniref:Uncharacterized protein n=1 Tax=Megaselia scalaris TaxID=36166 RepID=T1GGS4_MEGSC
MQAYSNYRGISVLNIAYKIFASIVYERLKAHVIRIIIQSAQYDSHHDIPPYHSIYNKSC